MAASQIPQSSPRTSTQSLWHGDAAVTALCAPPVSHCDAFHVCHVSLLLEKHSNLSLLWLRRIFWWSSDRCCLFSLPSLRYRPRVSNLTYTDNDKWSLFTVLTDRFAVVAFFSVPKHWQTSALIHDSQRMNLSNAGNQLTFSWDVCVDTCVFF